MSSEEKFHFNGEVLVRGRVDKCAECCPTAGDITITIPVDGPPINIENQKSYEVISAFNTDGGVYAVKVGEWIEAKVSCYGFMRKTNEHSVCLKINEKGHSINGSVGKVIIKKGGVYLDVGALNFLLHNKNDVDKTATGKKLTAFGISNRDYVMLEASLSMNVLRKGSEAEIYGKERKYWASDSKGFLAIIPFSASKGRYTFNTYKPKRGLYELLLAETVTNVIRCLLKKEAISEKQISQILVTSIKEVKSVVDELSGHGIVDTVSIPNTNDRVVYLRAKVVYIEGRE